MNNLRQSAGDNKTSHILINVLSEIWPTAPSPVTLEEPFTPEAYLKETAMPHIETSIKNEVIKDKPSLILKMLRNIIVDVDSIKKIINIVYKTYIIIFYRLIHIFWRKR